MKIKEVKARQDEIRKLAAQRDYEAAYAEEIRLYRDVLGFFSGHGHSLAEAALATGDIEFPRSTM